MTLAAVVILTAFVADRSYDRFTGFNKVVPAPPEYVPAIRTTLTSQVSTTGTIQANQQVSLNFDIGTGTAKIQQFLVGLGDQVTQGEPLARLDATELNQAVRSAQASLDAATARYSAAANPSADQLAAAQQSISSAQAQVTTDRDNLATLKNGPTADTLQSAQAAVDNAKGALLAAEASLKSAQDSVTTAQNNLNSAAEAMNVACASTSSSPAMSSSSTAGTPTGSSDRTSTASTASTSGSSACVSARATVTQDQLALQNAQASVNKGTAQNAVQSAGAALSSAEQKLATAQQPASAADIDVAQATLAAAQASLAAAQDRYNSLLNPTPDVILPLQANDESARDNLATAQQNLANTTITAPFDGEISQLNGSTGTEVDSNTAVFILLNPRLVRVNANVDQADMSNLKVGQPASITFDALTGQSYTGQVSAIGLTPTISQGVVTYVVTFTLDTSRLAANQPVPAPGMTASLTVQTLRTPNALVVPARAIRRLGNRATVTLKARDGGMDKVQPVTTGASNATETQVTNGLSDGDEVLISSGASAPATAAAGQFGGFGGGGGIGGLGGGGRPGGGR